MTDKNQDDAYLQLYHLADELRGIANYGIMNTSSPYAMENYRKVLNASARIVSILDKQPFDNVMTQYESNMGHISPAVGVETAVFQDEKILLMRRHDDGLWAIPGGMVDVGETLTDSALRELEEEGGMSGKIIRLLGIFDSRLWKTRYKLHLYHVIFEVSVENETPVVTREATDWGYFSANDLPGLSPGHDMRVPVLFKLLDGSMEAPYTDPPDLLDTE